MQESSGSINLEELLIAVPADYTASVVSAKSHFDTHGNFIGWGSKLSDLSNGKNALIHNAWDLVRRILLYESSFYLSNSIAQQLTDQVVDAIGEEQLAKAMGYDNINIADREQLDLFKRKLWQLATQDDYAKAHRFVQMVYDHVKDIMKLPIRDSGRGSYLLNLGQLLSVISPEKDVRRSGDFAFNGFSLKYRISEDGFPFKDSDKNVDNSTLFYPMVIYLQIQSAGISYAKRLVDAFKGNHISYPEDSVTHFSGKSIREVIRA